MRKSYKFAKKKKKPTFRYRMNHQIRIPTVIVIDETGEHLGEMPTSKALGLAQEKGLDLVEVNPNSNPSITKFSDYGKMKYLHEKQLKKQKAKVKVQEVKSVRISSKIGDHDLQTKKKQAEKFLEKGHKVKVELILRGREHKHQNISRAMLNEFVDNLNIKTKTEQEVTKQGSKLFIIIMPDNSNQENTNINQ